MDARTALLATHLAATLCVASACWYVQVVHYPLFRHAAELSDYVRRNLQRTTWLLGPLVAAEGVSAAAVLLWPPADASRPLLWLAAALLLAIWASTAFVQVPLHLRLARRGDPADVPRLVATNWVRTVGWSGRVAVLVAAWP